MISAATAPQAPPLGRQGFGQPPRPGQPLTFNPSQPPQGPVQSRGVLVSGVSGPQPPIKSRILAKPINRAEGLLKNYYDPKTVARDILIAAGRHPTERPLNAHMAGLLGRHIDIDSDLTTFDWDAIDPGGPPMPKVDYVDVPAAPPKYQLGQYVKRVESDPNKDKEGRLPDSDKRDSKAAPALAPASAPAPSTAPTSDSHQASNALHRAANSMVKRLSTLRQSHVPEPDTAKDATPRRQSQASPASPQRNRSAPSSTSQPPNSAKAEMISNDGIQRRRGRPPGAKSKNLSVAAMQRAARQVTSVTLPSPSNPHLPAYKCRWKGCKAHLHNSETLRHHVSKVHRQQEDDDTEYACWWKKCQYLKEDAEGMWQPVRTFSSVHDWLEHIDKDHIYPIALKQGDGPSTKHIGKQNKPSFDVSRFRYDPPVVPKTRTLSYLDPQTILTDKSRYLSDENGRITTPSITTKSNKDLEPDTMTLLTADHGAADQAAQRSFIKAHRNDKSSPKTVAEETLRALEANKSKFGPGMKNEGCVLVRDTVKSRLAQNPAIVRVVDADD